MYNATLKINVLENILQDDFYKCFLNSSQRTNVSTQELSISEQVKKLGDGIELISRELHEQVLVNHDDLLKQGSHATKLENVLYIMNTHVDNLFANAERLKNQIYGSYNTLQTHTKVLSRLQLASHILRQVHRIQQLSKRLFNTNDSVQKATILFELEQLASDPDLTEIDAVTSELRNIRIHQQKFVKFTGSSLNQGIINGNLSQTSTALQTFINLEIINTVLETSVKHILTDCRECIKTAFNISNVSIGSKVHKKPGRPTMTSSQGFRDQLWIEIEKLFAEDITQYCKQIIFLQSVLNTLDEDNSFKHLAMDFWSKLGQLIITEIDNSSTPVKQIFEEEYPKLLKCYVEMIEKLKFDQFMFNRHVLEMSENLYLSRSLAKLLDLVQSMFTNEVVCPPHTQIDSLVRSITEELSLSLIEANLNVKICKNASKSIRMFALKIEQQIETGPEAAQVIGGNANLAQQRNIQHANSLYYFQCQIQRMLLNMKESIAAAGIEIIHESIDCLINLVGAIVQPLVASTNSTVETIIITIHAEPDWAKLMVPTNKNMVPCSPYMRELTQFILRVYQTYLSDFENKNVILSNCSEIGIKSIELLVRHTSLLRPLSQGGRFRLQADYFHLEQALKIICPQLVDLGRPFRLLKSMASLVTLTPAEIVASQAAESSVPHSTVLFMLFSFGEPELASPHQNTAWSIPKLSAWLDNHTSEKERLDLIAGALQRYENLVRQNNSTYYDPVYPIMSTFLESAIKILI